MPNSQRGEEKMEWGSRGDEVKGDATVLQLSALPVATAFFILLVS